MKGLPYIVKNLVEKARDSALLGVEVYKKPRSSFRSSAYIILMIVAWTSLFHAIFQRKKISYFHKKGKRFVFIDGEKKTWEIQQCVSYYFQNENDPIRKNIEFFIGLRNKIEHRCLPKLDDTIFGECQSFLHNFEELLTKEFGQKYSISENLVFSLQFSKFDAKSIAKQEAKKDYRSVINYIQNYRSKLDESIWQDSKFSYRVYLIPKITARKNDSDIAVEFVKYDKSNPEEMKKYEHLVAFVTEKPVQVANQGKLKPGTVVKEVAKRLGKKFTMFMHTCCYRHFKVRPTKDDVEKMKCNTEYCQYDELHKDYIYTSEWVNFLAKNLQDEKTYDLIRNIKREIKQKK